MSQLLIEPNPAVAAIKAYRPGLCATAIDLALDNNEALSSPLADVDGLNRYPSTAALEQTLAKKFGVSGSQVLVTAGADDALERAIRTVCMPGREAILTFPTFVMLDRYVRLAGAGLVEIPWWSGEFPVREVCDRVGPQTALVAVVSPNNPTGSTITRPAFEELVSRLPKCLILLDHAYAEFADEDLTQSALAFPNVVVFRTFSKAWGCAGLRVGYAIGDPRVVGWMAALGQPFPVSVPSLEAVQKLLARQSEPEPAFVARIRNQCSRLGQFLTGLGVEALPSQANFVLAQAPDAIWFRDALLSLGIAVRAFPSPGELSRWLRITVPGDEAAYDRLEKAIEKAIAPQALLFDMDGVLVDVSGSYRATVVATAASYGVSIDAAVVAAAKRAGNANNDWELTHRLLAERGVQRSLDQVTARFEELYQGSATVPGLRANEKALLDRDQLSRLAAICPLAVVTGRTRRDAQRFLDEHHLSDCFAALVTMEDAAAKPDPAPVRLALDRLGVTRAWMFGDNPDDMVAARAAGVVAVGIIPGDDDPASTTEALQTAGAGCVFARIDQVVDRIVELLP